MGKSKVEDEKSAQSKDEKGSSDDKEDTKKYGEPRKHDPNFNGPIKKRSCTDIICCLLFMFFLAGMVACSAIGYARGDPYKLLYPTDTSGRICGYDAAVKSKPYLMFFDLLDCAKLGTAVIYTGCPTPQVCVSSCTTSYYVWAETVAKEGAGTKTASDRTTDMLCKEGVDPTTPSTANIYSDLISTEQCASYYVPTTQVVGRCIPSIFLQLTDWAAQLATTDGTGLVDSYGNNVTGNGLNDASYWIAKFMSASEIVELVFKDIISSWYLLLVFLGIAMVGCFLWIILLRFIAGIMVWLTIVLVLGCLGFAIYYSYSTYYDLKNQNITATWQVSEAFALNFSYYLGLKETWLAFGCTLSTFTTIFLLILIFLLPRIKIAIELIKEGSRAIGNMIFTLFWPIIPFVLQAVLIGYMGISAVYIASMGDSSYYTNGTNTTQDTINYYLERIPCSPNDTTLGSYCDFVKYGGTEYIIPMQVFMLFMFFWAMNFIVALGQMVLAGSFASYYWAFDKPKDIPAFPLTASLYRSLRYHLGSLAFGALIIAIIQMIRVVLEYIDYKLKDSKNVIAVYGKNFCTAAKDAFFLIIRNVVRAVVLDKITDYVLFLSKLLVTAGVVEDLEMNDGSPEKPYFMSKGLMKILGKKNTKDPNEKKKGCCGCC
ncbi:hypothetical protein FSP39_021397 [Pinctada imbricata]|uniref:Choline transporter-like protein n=1 Tax=Pinctada imbricata TaxID=66713 RepID=A0AA88XNK9_PINIB|nr:hypothetical protein FSP39_021397 [Pinctada imbricata]